MVIRGHNLGNSQVSVNRTIGPTLVFSFLLPRLCAKGRRLAQCSASQTTDQGVPGLRPGRVAVHCGLEQITFTPCLNPRSSERTTDLDRL